MPSISDRQSRKIGRNADFAVGSVIRDGMLKCPFKGCDCNEYTHVVDVVWECDPYEQDRRWVRLEIRCETGHGFMLLVRNHGGQTRFEYQVLKGEMCAFEEGVRW